MTRGGGVASMVGWAPGATPRLESARLSIRPPQRGDHEAWAQLRRESHAFLKPWEPAWSTDHLGPNAFRRRVSWTKREILAGRAYPFLLFARRPDPADPPLDPAHSGLVGGVTLEYVRRGAAMSAALGYWLGAPYVGRGYMSEALASVIAFAFHDLDLSRLEAACLPENIASRRVLERVGFVQEGLARNYLQIDGAWRDHLLFELRRSDRL